MRNSILLSLLLLPLALMAQVGIGTTTPNASAKLDVTSTSQGFLPPRVALTATSDATTIKNAAGTSITPATGLFVYNTATAGSSPSNVTPGLYYYDGSKWQRVINQQPDATIEFDKATPTTASVVFTPNTPASKDYVYVSTVDNSQWTYNGSIYTTYTPPASTAWNLAGGTTDAGSNKTGGIVRTGKVGIGSAITTLSNILEVNGTGGTGTGLKLTTGGGANKLLTSDASGNASWVTNLVFHYVGESYGGGTVFYVYDNGTHGLIAAPADQSTGIIWCPVTNTNINAVRNGIEAGKFNTERIIANQGIGSYAAQLCANYQGGTLGDWYLPSIHELYLLYNQRSVVAGLTGVYWSSSESSINSAWNENLDTGEQISYNWKTDQKKVRAIRAF